MQGYRLRIGIVLAAAVLMAALSAITVQVLERTHDTAEATAGDMVERAARLAEVSLARHLAAVDGALAGIPSVLGGMRLGDTPAEPEAVTTVLRSLNLQALGVANLVLFRPDGTRWAAALPDGRLRTPPRDPAASEPPLHLLGPVRGGRGEPVVFLQREITVQGPGRLLAVAEMPVAQLAALLDPVAELRGLGVSVLQRDGRIVTVAPFDELRIGAQAPATGPTDGRAREAGGLLTRDRVLEAARTIPDGSLVVAASIPLPDALAKWQQDRNRLVLYMLGIGALLVGFAIALNFALRQREASEAERESAQRVLENALDSMADGFVMFDAEDRLVVCNRRYREFYAVSAPHIRPGARFADIIREGALRGQYPQAGEDIEAFVTETTAWHRGNNAPIERLLPDGRWILVTERSTPDGGTVGIRTDITTLKQAMAALATARDAAAAATEAKSRFLARMSHELRTPLNGVLGLAQVLAADPTLPEAARAQARTLEMAGRHLLAVANDVLDLARIEAGKIELQPAPMSLPALLETCATLVRPAAQEKLVTVKLTVRPGLPDRVEADSTRIRQLLINLLSNAVKFSPQGAAVELRAAAIGVTGPGGPPVVRLEVRDNGPGVPEDKRSAVFGDFVQVERTGTSEGTGLGLAIAAHIVERMGGRIGCDGNAEAKDGRGAVFWVEVPLPLAKAQPAEAAAAGDTGAGHGPAMRVLVADDVPANQIVARALLESAGHMVECVGDGFLAVEAVARTGAGTTPPFDAVLMDVMMPGMDGLEAARRIRALAGPPGRVPILAVTASAFPEDIKACREAGMDGHVMKPIDRATLLARLREVRTLPGGPAVAAEAGAEPTDALSRLPLLLEGDGPARVRIPGLEPEAAFRLVPEFLREIRAAAEEIRRVEPRPHRVLSDAAHRLAGSAATLGAERLAAAARALEAASRLRTGTEGTVPERREVALAIAAETLTLLEAEAARSDDTLTPIKPAA